MRRTLRRILYAGLVILGMVSRLVLAQMGGGMTGGARGSGFHGKKRCAQ
jgi:hypothetical protein